MGKNCWYPDQTSINIVYIIYEILIQLNEVML